MRSKVVLEDMGAKNYGTQKCELFENIPLDIQNIATNSIYNYYVPEILPLTLIQAKNGDKIALEIKISCNQWDLVPNVYPTRYHHVLLTFPKFPSCFVKCSQ